MKIDLSNDCIFIKGLFKNESISYEEIKRAYMRIEEVKANMCCGRMNFDRHFLVLNRGDEIIKVEMDSKKKVEEALFILKTKNPAICIGNR